MIERRGEGIEVATRVGSGALDLFERRVIPRIAKDTLCRRLVPGIRRISLSQTKIKQHDLAARRQFQILRFYVPVYDGNVLIVQVIKSVQKLVGPLYDGVDRKRLSSAFQEMCE